MRFDGAGPTPIIPAALTTAPAGSGTGDTATPTTGEFVCADATAARSKRVPILACFMMTGMTKPQPEAFRPLLGTRCDSLRLVEAPVTPLAPEIAHAPPKFLPHPP